MNTEATGPTVTTRGADWQAPNYRSSQTRALNPEHLRRQRCVGYFPDEETNRAYKVLRTQVLQRMHARGWNTLMITSPRPGAGKTLTAVNLALICAREYAQTVLLVDCDLRRQHIHTMLGVESCRGIADYLLYGTTLNELIIWPGVDKFTFIAGGDPVSDSTELLNSPRMKALVPEMKGRYHDRIVIYDTPALLDDADALAFMPLVDAVLIVLEYGRTAKDDLGAALGLIPPEKRLGCVLNRHADLPAVVPS